MQVQNSLNRDCYVCWFKGCLTHKRRNNTSWGLVAADCYYKALSELYYYLVIHVNFYARQNAFVSGLVKD